MRDPANEVVAIAASCLGGLRGRSALLVGPEEQRLPYLTLLQQADMKYVYQIATPDHASAVIPHIQLLISLPAPVPTLQLQQTPQTPQIPLLTAAVIAEGCIGRRTPLLIFDIAETTSVEELAGLLPAVCLYTPDDMRHIFARRAMRDMAQRLWQSQEYAS